MHNLTMLKNMVRCSIIVFLAGCGGSAWTVPLAGLDGAVLSVFGRGPRDVFFAGGGLGSGPGALALRFDGSAFIDLQPNLAASLWWVAGVGAEVWFCGEKGTLLRWDGTTLVATASGTDRTLYGVWGAAPDDVWAVGGEPGSAAVLLHWDGAAWRPAANLPALPGALFKVWGSSARDVFAVGEAGRILHFDGRVWQEQASGLPRSVTLFTVAGRGPSEVYAVGGLGSGTALRYDGSAWSPLAGFPKPGSSLTGVSVTAAGDLSLAGLGGARFRGRAEALIDDSRLPPSSDFHATWLSGPEDIFLVGGAFNAPKGSPRQGLIAHYGAALPSTRR